MLLPKDLFGFIVADGNGALFGTLRGNLKTTLESFTVDLPRKHGRGGQSSNRFERIRTEKRHNFLREVAEATIDNFITNNMPNVKCLVIAGSAEIKNDLLKSDLFDKRLRSIQIEVVDIMYGGELGFQEAIEKASGFLSGVRLVDEKKVLKGYFNEINKSSNLWVSGVKETTTFLLSKLIKNLIVFENIDLFAVTLKNDPEVKFLSTKDLEEIPNSEIEEERQFIDWLIDEERYKTYVDSMEFVSDSSSEGTQFVRGFGGIGGILRYGLEKEDFFEKEEEIDFDDFI